MNDISTWMEFSGFSIEFNHSGQNFDNNRAVSIDFFEEKSKDRISLLYMSIDKFLEIQTLLLNGYIVNGCYFYENYEDKITELRFTVINKTKEKVK